MLNFNFLDLRLAIQGLSYVCSKGTLKGEENQTKNHTKTTTTHTDNPEVNSSPAHYVRGDRDCLSQHHAFRV